MATVVTTRWFNQILLVLTAMIWGFAFVAQRSAMESIGPWTFNGVRFLCGGVALAIFFNGRVRGLLQLPSEIRRGHFRGIVYLALFLCLGAACQQSAMLEASAGRAGFITSLYLVFIPIILWVSFRERTGVELLFALLLALSGMYLLTDPLAGKSAGNADGLLVLGAFLFAGHVVAINKIVPNKDPVVLAIGQFLLTGIVSLGIAICLEPIHLSGLRAALVPIFYASFISCAIGYTLQVVAQAHVPAIPAAIIMSLESVFGLLGGALLLGERMEFREHSGCVLLLLAAILAQVPFLVIVGFVRNRLKRKALPESA